MAANLNQLGGNTPWQLDGDSTDGEPPGFFKNIPPLSRGQLELIRVAINHPYNPNFKELRVTFYGRIKILSNVIQNEI